MNVVEQKGSKNGSCYRCGGKHSQETCKFKQADCFNCGKTGHIAKACRLKAKTKAGKFGTKKPDKAKANVVSADAEESEIGILVVEPVKKSKPITAMVRLEGKVLEMEVDTGAAISLVSERTFMKHWGNKRLL